MKHFYTTWLVPFFQLGVVQEMDAELEKNIVLTNKFAFTWILLIIPYIVIFSWHDMFWVYMLSLLIGFHILVLFLHSRRLYYVGRVIEGIVPQFIIFIIAARVFPAPDYNKLSSFYMLNIAFLAIPFMIFSLKEYWFIIISVISSMLMFYFFDPVNALFHLESSSFLYDEKWFIAYNYSVAAGMIVIGFIYVKQSSTYFKEKTQFSEEKFKDIFNNTTEGISIIDLNGMFLEANKVVLDRMGVTPEQLKRINALDMMQNHSKSEKDEVYNKIIKDGNFVFETEYTNKKGMLIPIEIKCKLITLNGRKLILNVTNDITERKQIQRKIYQTIFETQENERKRFARDLHDGLGAILSTIKLYIDLAKKTVANKEKQAEVSKQAFELTKQAISSTREISFNLIPDQLNRFGLKTAFKSFISRISSVSDIHIEFDDDNFNATLSEEVEINVYRVFNELVNNTLKHSRANNMFIRFQNNEAKALFIFSDDGVGFELEKKLKAADVGTGLKNIINRLEAIDAKYEINSSPGKGTEIFFELMLKNNRS